MNLYLGSPQEFWDGLCQQAEDILIEENIGQHIVGLYSYGDRLFGRETGAEDILCLYLDTSEEILDPFYNPKIQKIRINNLGSQIIFHNLRDWIKRLQSPDLSHLTICFGDAFFEDESISKIISLSEEHLLQFGIRIKEETDSFFECRTKIIFNLTKKFSPDIKTNSLANINDKRLVELDKEICQEYINNKTNIYKSILMEKEYKKRSIKYNIEHYIHKNSQESLEKIAKETINFYKILL